MLFITFNINNIVCQKKKTIDNMFHNLGTIGDEQGRISTASKLETSEA